MPEPLPMKTDTLTGVCDCDPGEAPTVGIHSFDCPAWKMVRHMLVRIGDELLPLMADLADTMRGQDRAYGPFTDDVPGVRLAAAALQDEADEVRGAWRAERKADGWPTTRVEAIQTAAVAMRLVRDTEDVDAAS